jgi:hypothetical protein
MPADRYSARRTIGHPLHVAFGPSMSSGDVLLRPPRLAVGVIQKGQPGASDVRQPLRRKAQP